MNYARIMAVASIGILAAIAPHTVRATPGMVLTVGPGGSQPTIQAAINAALGSLGSSPIEIRVAAGTYRENITVPPAMNQGQVIVSGGWNSDFTVRDLDPSLTSIDGSVQDRVFNISPAGGELTIDGFAITNGRVNGFGGGLSVEPTGASRVTISNNLILGNVSVGQSPSTASGGGIWAYLKDTSRVLVSDNIIIENRSDGGTDTEAYGGGMRVVVDQDALVTIRHNRIEANDCVGTGCIAAGIYVATNAGGSGEVSDNLVRGNETSDTPTSGAAGALWMTGTGRITARRNMWVDNVINFPAEDLSLIAADSATLLITDSVVAGARSFGVLAEARGGSSIYLTNMTVADNQNRGLFFRKESDDTGTTTLYNSIVFNNGNNTDLTGVTAGNNLVNVDPHFVDSARRDYTLLPLSPVINAGNNAPPGALGPSDVFGHARVASGTVDIGAVEVGEPDFLLSFDESSVSVTRGKKVKVSVSIIRTGSFDGSVTITPPDLSAIGVKSKPPGPRTTNTSNVKFTLKVKRAGVTGTHIMTFTGRDESGRERAVTVVLKIQ